MSYSLSKLITMNGDKTSQYVTYLATDENIYLNEK